MKKFLLPLISIIALGTATSLFAGTPSFSVSMPVIQNMVPNSSQNLAFILSTISANAVVIQCSFTTSAPGVTYSFNNNGCALGGVGINNNLPDTVNFTLNIPASASGSISGTLTFQQTNGRHTTQPISIPITVPVTTNRTITFRNYCPFNVAFATSSSSVPAKNLPVIACTTNADCSSYTYSNCVGGFCRGGACNNDSQCVNANAGTCAVPAGSPSGTSASCSYCASDGDCMDGSSCNTSSHLCYWNNPAPSDASTNHYILSGYTGSGNPSSDTVTLTDNSSTNGYALLWGGSFAGRGNCTFNSTTNQLDCDSATCNTSGSGDGEGGCNLGEGFTAPVSAAEATFVTNVPDTYDVTIINGSSIPVAMHPTSGSTATPQQYANPYICGSAGNSSSTATSNGTLGACSWNFSPPTPSLAYRWVKNDDGTTCSSDSTCEAINSQYRCGLTKSAVSTASGSTATVCGTALGYWNQNEICATNANFNQPSIVDCTQTNIGGSGNSIINLLGCTSTGGGSAGTSCYSVGSASTTCCGCTNWQNQGVSVPTNSSVVEQCLYPNANWGGGDYPGNTGSVLPGLIWLKQACPSAYVYPFDDASSTFTCPSNGGQSAVNYTVDFCPGQETGGLPANP